MVLFFQTKRSRLSLSRTRVDLGGTARPTEKSLEGQIEPVYVARDRLDLECISLA